MFFIHFQNVHSFSDIIPSKKLCLEKMLEMRNYDEIGHEKLASGIGGSRFMMSKSRDECRLMHYTSEHVTKCLDLFDKDKSKVIQRSPADYVNEKQIKDREWLHFAFVGDSRIRHQFTSFLKVCFYIYSLCYR